MPSRGSTRGVASTAFSGAGLRDFLSNHLLFFFLRSHTRAGDARRDNGTITGTMCVAEGGCFRHHGSFAKALGETSRRPLADLVLDHGSREDTRVVISKEA